MLWMLESLYDYTSHRRGLDEFIENKCWELIKTKNSPLALRVPEMCLTGNWEIGKLPW